MDVLVAMQKLLFGGESGMPFVPHGRPQSQSSPSPQWNGSLNYWDMPLLCPP